MAYYRKDLKFDLGQNLVEGKAERKAELSMRASQNATNNAMNRARLDNSNKQQALENKRYEDNKTAKFELEKSNKEDEVKNKTSVVGGMRKIHPKTTADMTDDEIFAMANKIQDTHNDPQRGKFVNSFTATNGDRVMVTYNGNDKDGNPIYKNVVVGKVPVGGTKSSSSKGRDSKTSKSSKTNNNNMGLPKEERDALSDSLMKKTKKYKNAQANKTNAKFDLES